MSTKSYVTSGLEMENRTRCAKLLNPEYYSLSEPERKKRQGESAKRQVAAWTGRIRANPQWHGHVLDNPDETQDMLGRVRDYLPELVDEMEQFCNEYRRQKKIQASGENVVQLRDITVNANK